MAHRCHIGTRSQPVRKAHPFHATCFHVSLALSPLGFSCVCAQILRIENTLRTPPSARGCRASVRSVGYEDTWQSSKARSSSSRRRERAAVPGAPGRARRGAREQLSRSPRHRTGCCANRRRRCQSRMPAPEQPQCAQRDLGACRSPLESAVAAF